MLVLGILLIIGGIISLILLGVGSSNSKTEGSQTVPYGSYYVIGGKSAEKIIVDYSASKPVDVYVTTDDSVTGFIWSVDSLDDLEKLETGTGGHIEYETEDSGIDCYLLFVNDNEGTSANVNAEVEFQQSGFSNMCLGAGVVLLILGIVFIVISRRMKGKASKAPQYQTTPAHTQQGYQVGQFPQQPSQDPYPQQPQQQSLYHQPPSQPGYSPPPQQPQQGYQQPQYPQQQGYQQQSQYPPQQQY
jgi:hypothetical protein